MRDVRVVDRRWAKWAMMALVALVLTACGASSKFMAEAQAPMPLVPAQGQAMVVFIRPPGFVKGPAMTIMDGRGRFLGDSLPGTYFTANVPPGEHLFIGWAENTAVVRATVEAGRTYYVRVSPRMGVWSARVQLLALTPRSEDFSELQEWIADSQLLIANEAAGQAHLLERAEDVQERIARANERWAKYDPEERAERIIGPEDGMVAAGAASAPPPPSTAPTAAPPAATPSAPAAPAATPTEPAPPAPTAAPSATAPSGGCTTNADCQGGQVCQSGACVAAPATGGCQSDDECKGARVCRNGSCVSP